MESVKQIKNIRQLFIALPCFFILISCKSQVYDPLVLQEIAPLPKSIVRQTATEYEPVYSTLRIIEVSEVNGVQKFFLVRFGTDKTGVSVGVTGDIGEDATFQRIIGTYVIVELQGNFFRCEITELAYRIGNNAHVRIKVGEKVKEASAS